MKPATALLAVLPVLSAACLGRGTPISLPSVASDGCPTVLLTRTGGLGFEAQSGVLAAVWPSGTIIRSEAAALPMRYMIGQLGASDTAALLEMVPKAWDQPRQEGVLDSPDDVLTVRRGQEVRQWSETPGFTSTPTVADFRTRLFSLPIEGARRVSSPLREVYDCAPRR